MLSPRLLQVLRRYWYVLRPPDYLFPSWHQAQHLSTTALQLACHAAAARAGIAKRVTVHPLAPLLGHSPAGERHRHPRPPGAAARMCSKRLE